MPFEPSFAARSGFGSRVEPKVREQLLTRLDAVEAQIRALEQRGSMEPGAIESETLTSLWREADTLYRVLGTRRRARLRRDRK